MSSFFQPTYWLTLQPPEVDGLAGNVLFGVFVAFLVLGIIGRIVVERRGDDQYKKEIGNRISSLLITMGIIGVILYFFSFEEVQLFGARFWYLLWIIAVLVWGFFLVRFVRRDIPAKREREETLKAQAKYLPHRRRR